MSSLSPSAEWVSPAAVEREKMRHDDHALWLQRQDEAGARRKMSFLWVELGAEPERAAA